MSNYEEEYAIMKVMESNQIWEIFFEVEIGFHEIQLMTIQSREEKY